MSANPQSAQIASDLSIRHATRADWRNPGLLRDYFVSAAAGLGRDLELNTATLLLARAMEPPVALGLLADSSDGALAGLLLEDKSWDTEMLGVRVRNLTLLASAPGRESRHEIAEKLAVHCIEHYSAEVNGCVFARISSDDAASLSALEGIGFRGLVAMVTLGREAENDFKVAAPEGIELSDVWPEEIGQVCKIASTAFRWGRFSVDPRVPTDVAETIHATWARNCCLGEHANRVIVARDGHDVLGFIALKVQKIQTTQIGAIELIAVAESARGRGLSAVLIRESCKWLSKFARNIIVRTELPNTAALRMYESQGFRVLNGSLYLSRWHAPSTRNFSR